MPKSRRTAAEAEEAVNRAVGQIVKSLIFETDTGKLVLLLVSGKHKLDSKNFSVHGGWTLQRGAPICTNSKTAFFHRGR